VNLTIRLRFATKPGQSLWLVGPPPLPLPPVVMQFLDEQHWQVTLPFTKAAAGAVLNYSFILREADGSQRMDWGNDRRLRLADFKADELLVFDSWNEPGFFANAFYTGPFKNVLLAGNVKAVPAAKSPSATHTFRVKAPLLGKSQALCLLGEGPILGDWQTARPIRLSRAAGEDYFSVSLDLRNQFFPFAYKYGVFDVQNNSFLRFEDGANRLLDAASGAHIVVNDGFMNLPADTWRGAGVAVPVFSLRSEDSFGVGEFLDLKRFADWGKQAGLKLIQLLPINDTSATNTWKDSYPYAAISAFALHPLYLNLAAAAGAKNKELLKTLEPERQRLNALDALDYEAVIKLKLGFLRKIFPLQKASIFGDREYKKFFAANAHWLVPYAAFCFLRDKHGTVDSSQWPEHRTFSGAAIAALVQDNAEIAFYYFVQFHLHSQLQAAAAHVRACGLVLKGDIAIGVHRHGADAWQAPELYHMDMQAGAPPDPFSAKGQNWGFPTYNWPRMADDGFAWWKRRFAQMGEYFDAFRIDHILGFFRIWSIPLDAVEGILGHFEPALPVAETEFASRGIHFERRRLLQPFINDAVIEKIFGAALDLVRAKFLRLETDGLYSLKPEFATQRQVETYFAAPDQAKLDGKLKLGLFDLISNVILLESAGKLHFRFAMDQTSSFQHLLPDQQARLHELYVDYFFRRQDDYWRHEAMMKLPALKRETNMLVCGEDLGLVPACVPGVMKELGLLSLEIQRMPKTLGVEFSRPADAPYLSVVTPSTHDMSTIRGWWAEEPRELVQKFFNHELGLPGEAPAGATPEIVRAVVKQHLMSPAMWSIFQLQDLLGMDNQLRRPEVAAERINVPATPDYYWRYRMHLTVEQLQVAKEFNLSLSTILVESGR
jgi:4-alpha-glucanotransferase